MAGFCFVSALAIVQVGWLPLPSPRSAGYPAIFEMHVIEELKRSFERFPSLDYVQSWGVLPMAFMGENSGAQGRFATVILGRCGVFHDRSVDCAARPCCADRRVRSVLLLRVRSSGAALEGTVLCKVALK